MRVYFEEKERNRRMSLEFTLYHGQGAIDQLSAIAILTDANILQQGLVFVQLFGRQEVRCNTGQYRTHAFVERRHFIDRLPCFLIR